MPREEIHLPRIEHSVVLELPPPGSVVPATLGDGTPVWRVHREDGTVSVFSALIPRTHGSSSVGLTQWIPTMRRFIGVYVWDDRGTVLGNQGWDACTGGCPSTDDMPDSARDLDAFQVERLEGEPARLRVGAPISGAWRRMPRKPLPSWTQEPHEDVTPPMSLEQALRLPEGTIVHVQGSVVLASASPPRVCQRYGHWTCCGEGNPRLYDVDGIPLRRTGLEVYSHGFALLRRYRDGFVQYDVGARLDAPHAGGHLDIPPPADLESWDPAQPPRVPICK
ncbi:hypothetical protein COCOR_01729 [Corallococcus coralloides DSM 2259]|uniref:Uncharacterized protein n=1 Tax=Corallococcus coralloides (strain ATCC 25202 / DSM 2259 / NBRC 100086 / M2) TaxID=1144275 RepID=H8N065_CORCM|nr:hypothetical protein [Corallococcus coralloides]AFE04253.1 hypothetical protein COCOR_01729 [Corallococcus coralloides DSM 2259]